MVSDQTRQRFYTASQQQTDQPEFEQRLERCPSITLGTLAADCRTIIDAHAARLKRSRASHEGIQDAIEFWRTVLRSIEGHALWRDRNLP